MQTLFVNCCPRGEASRTLRLAEVFLAALREKLPGLNLLEQNPHGMGLAPCGAIPSRSGKPSATRGIGRTR